MKQTLQLFTFLYCLEFSIFTSLSGLLTVIARQHLVFLVPWCQCYWQTVTFRPAAKDISSTFTFFSGLEFIFTSLLGLHTVIARQHLVYPCTVVPIQTVTFRPAAKDHEANSSTFTFFSGLEFSIFTSLSGLLAHFRPDLNNLCNCSIYLCPMQGLKICSEMVHTTLFLTVRQKIQMEATLQLLPSPIQNGDPNDGVLFQRGGLPCILGSTSRSLGSHW